MNEEQWKPIQEYEGKYEVSNLGHVRSLERRDSTGRRKVPAHLMTPRPQGLKRKGPPYYAVGLTKDGKLKNKKVAQLVATAFLGPRPKGLEINHKDTDKKHNAADNLEYVTSARNKQHAWEAGIYWHRGPEHPQSKLTKKQVLEIWNLRNEGLTEHDAAKRYPVSYVTIGDIWRKKRYRHLLVGEPRDRSTMPGSWAPPRLSA
jgi:hypothetical protein